MKVQDVMSRDVQFVSPEQPIAEAARMMLEADTGALPVGDQDQVTGMITDRDIAIRAVAEGKGPDATVREVMTQDVKYCFEDDDVDQVTRNMAENQVRRLPVLNRDKRLVGIISLGDLVISRGPDQAGEALSGISQPGGPHSQTGGDRT